jgi:ketosteroid isomerase-like protein
VSAVNVELVRRFYDALNANELASLGSLCDEIDYVNPDFAAEPGTRRGPEAFRSAVEGLHASFEDFRCEIDAVTPVGDAVVVVARSTGTERSRRPTRPPTSRTRGSARQSWRSSRWRRSRPTSVRR